MPIRGKWQMAPRDDVFMFVDNLRHHCLHRFPLGRGQRVAVHLALYNVSVHALFRSHLYRHLQAQPGVRP